MVSPVIPVYDPQCLDSTFCVVGWGQYLGQYLSLPVVNNAIAGRSARSYTDEGRFTSLINAAQKGDYVGKFLDSIGVP